VVEIPPRLVLFVGWGLAQGDLRLMVESDHLGVEGEDRLRVVRDAQVGERGDLALRAEVGFDQHALLRQPRDNRADGADPFAVDDERGAAQDPRLQASAAEGPGETLRFACRGVGERVQLPRSREVRLPLRVGDAGVADQDVPRLERDDVFDAGDDQIASHEASPPSESSYARDAFSRSVCSVQSQSESISAGRTACRPSRARAPRGASVA
jgi:hypothetical protein